MKTEIKMTTDNAYEYMGAEVIPFKKDDGTDGEFSIVRFADVKTGKMIEINGAAEVTELIKSDKLDIKRHEEGVLQLVVIFDDYKGKKDTKVRFIGFAAAGNKKGGKS